jgi:hypothetical protein
MEAVALSCVHAAYVRRDMPCDEMVTAFQARSLEAKWLPGKPAVTGRM